MARFETIPAQRAHCGPMACLMRDVHREAIIGLGLDPFQEIAMAFDQTPNPTAWLVDNELAALGGVAGPPLLCPIGFAWLAVAESAIRFRHPFVKVVKQQLDAVQKLYPLLVTPLCPADKKSLRFAAFLGFAVEYAYLQDGLLFAVYSKNQRSSVELQEAA
jgi:hypothetical protein